MANRLTLYGICLVVVWLLASRLRSARARQTAFLIFSYVLYASWEPWFLAILILSSVMNYVLGAYLRKHPVAPRLWVAIVLNLLLLSFFKYLPPVAAGSLHSSRLTHIVLPIGISFWTFQALSYLFDIYRGQELDPSLLEFCLYLAFWPTVLSGPICRLGAMLPQFRADWHPSWSDLGGGFRRIFIGAFMMGLAQLLGSGLAPGQGVNAGFDQTSRWGGLDVWCLLVGFGFQLFFDFAGYSHAAIGLARVFGFELQENFDRPYLSTTPSVFWTRWHMSLSFWIRDYVFLPLATARAALWWRNAALVISMVAFGLWHKGSLLYIIWGAYHGVLLVLHRQWQQVTRRLGVRWSGRFASVVSWAVTFAGISLGWIFFRVHDQATAFSMLRTVFSPASYRHVVLGHNFYLLVVLAMTGYFAVLAVTSLLNRLQEALAPRTPLTRISGTALRDRWVWIAPLILVGALYLFVIMQPQNAAASPFLYRLF